MTESGSTRVPGQIIIFSTRPSVLPGIQRMFSGSNVPRPRTWRTIGPRFTVSIQTLERSTLGAAGFNRDKANVANSNPTALTEISQCGACAFLRQRLGGEHPSRKDRG